MDTAGCSAARARSSRWTTRRGRSRCTVPAGPQWSVHCGRQRAPRHPAGRPARGGEDGADPDAGPWRDTLNVATAAAVALYYLLDATVAARHAPRGPSRTARRCCSPRPATTSRRAAHCVRRRRSAGSASRSTTVRRCGSARRARSAPRPEPPRAATVTRCGWCRPATPGRAARQPGRRLRTGRRRAAAAPHRPDRPGTVLVIPDTDGWEPRPGTEFARVAVPGVAGRYRLLTGIVLAEAARQLGIRAAAVPRPPRRGMSSAAAWT